MPHYILIAVRDDENGEQIACDLADTLGLAGVGYDLLAPVPQKILDVIEAEWKLDLE